MLAPRASGRSSNRLWSCIAATPKQRVARSVLALDVEPVADGVVDLAHAAGPRRRGLVCDAAPGLRCGPAAAPSWTQGLLKSAGSASLRSMALAEPVDSSSRSPSSAFTWLWSSMPSAHTKSPARICISVSPSIPASENRTQLGEPDVGDPPRHAARAVLLAQHVRRERVQVSGALRVILNRLLRN